MSTLPPDFASLLPRTSAAPEKGPIYFLWVFDPHEDKVILEHNEDRHPADAIDHGILAEKVPHPDRLHGFAYRIKGGWRITTDDHKPVDDAHVKELVRKSLQNEKHERSDGSRAQLRAIK
jgi:hypothetical protein